MIYYTPLPIKNSFNYLLNKKLLHIWNISKRKTRLEQYLEHLSINFIT